MKVLVLSSNVWRDDTNAGNVLSNIFDGTGFEFATVYCGPGVPDNKLCTKYFQITDKMIVKNLLQRKKVGRAFEYDLTHEVTMQAKEQAAEPENKKVYNWFRKHSLSIFKVMQEVAWKLADWKNDALKKFILDFEPDVIFAPCYASFRMLRLSRFVSELTGKKLVSYISDDSHSMRQFRVSPVYWLNRIMIRNRLRKTFPYYSLVYTMTEQQKIECEQMFGANMQVLRKSVEVSSIPQKTTINAPIRLIFGGGIYCGRWKTLSKIADAIERLNSEGYGLHLDIYTGNVLTKRQAKLLNRDGVVCVHKPVPYNTLKEIYAKQDIALHVESLDIKNRLLTRLSFSTKIVDCLASGCATLAIAWKEHAGLVYLREKNAAFCIDNPNEIYNLLKTIAEKPETILDYQARAVECCKKYHNRNDNLQMILSDFERMK